MRIWAPASIAVFGCTGPAQSFDEIAPHIAISWSGHGVPSEGSLAVDAEFVGLRAEASMRITFRGSEVPFVLREPEKFSGSVPLHGVDPVEGEPLEIALVIDSERAVSTATLPAPFTIESAQRNADTVDMTWSPTSTDRLWVEGEVIQISNHLCTITNGMLPIMDTGTAAVPLAGFHPMGMNCNNFKLSMVRARDGVVAPDLAPGAIVTMQRREIISI